MYCSLVRSEINFDKNKYTQKQELRKGRLLYVLPLADKQAVLFYDDYWFYLIDLNTMENKYQQKLEGRVYKAVAVKKDKILCMIVEKRNIIQIDLKNRKIKEIYRITAGSYVNPKKQITQFFLSNLEVFIESNSFYLKKILTDERKIVYVWFQSQAQIKSSEGKFQIRQFEAKNYIYAKLDEVSEIVRFRQNSQQNGWFTFQSINLKTQEINEHKFEYFNFVLYTATIVEVKRISEQKYLIGLNSKQSGHQMIVYNKVEKTVQSVFSYKKILLKYHLINCSLNFAVCSFIYGQNNYTEIINVIDLSNGKILDSIQAKVDIMTASLSQDYLLDYQQEIRQKPFSQLNIYSLVGKRTNYLKMMENIKLNIKYGQEFIQLIANMLT